MDLTIYTGWNDATTPRELPDARSGTRIRGFPTGSAPGDVGSEGWSSPYETTVITRRDYTGGWI
jgi:hypothetical protein